MLWEALTAHKAGKMMGLRWKVDWGMNIHVLVGMLSGCVN